MAFFRRHGPGEQKALRGITPQCRNELQMRQPSRPPSATTVRFRSAARRTLLSRIARDRTSSRASRTKPLSTFNSWNGSPLSCPSDEKPVPKSSMDNRNFLSRSRATISSKTVLIPGQRGFRQLQHDMSRFDRMASTGGQKTVRKLEIHKVPSRQVDRHRPRRSRRFSSRHRSVRSSSTTKLGQCLDLTAGFGSCNEGVGADDSEIGMTQARQGLHSANFAGSRIDLGLEPDLEPLVLKALANFVDRQLSASNGLAAGIRGQPKATYQFAENRCGQRLFDDAREC